jgi:hypothetical protein
MKKTSLLFLSLVISLFLFSCNTLGEKPLVVPSHTPEPSATVTPTSTRVKPTATPKPTLTPTVTLIPSYPTRQVLLDYIGRGYHSDYEMYFADGINQWSKLVLYADGQLIILRDGTYQQRILTPDEINQLFSKLEALGFYSVESNQLHDPTDKLYNFGGKYEEMGVTDGLEYCIWINREKSRDLCVYEPYLEYLTSQMRAILRFLDGYQPEGLSPYSPDRILLRVEVGRNTYDTELPEKTIPWTESSLSLEPTFTNILYVEGENAKTLFNLYGEQGHMFTQNDKEYTVYIRAVLPHEEITNIYDQ